MYSHQPTGLTLLKRKVETHPESLTICMTAFCPHSLLFDLPADVFRVVFEKRKLAQFVKAYPDTVPYPSPAEFSLIVNKVPFHILQYLNCHPCNPANILNAFLILFPVQLLIVHVSQSSRSKHSPQLTLSSTQSVFL